MAHHDLFSPVLTTGTRIMTSKATISQYVRVPGRYNTLAPFLVMSGNQESITGSGNISVECFCSKLYTTDSHVYLKLNNGLQDGQLKKLKLVHKGKEGTHVTIDCPALLGASHKMLFTNVGDSVLLAWTGGSWCVMETGNTSDPTLMTPVIV